MSKSPERYVCTFAERIPEWKLLESSKDVEEYVKSFLCDKAMCTIREKMEWGKDYIVRIDGARHDNKIGASVEFRVTVTLTEKGEA